MVARPPVFSLGVVQAIACLALVTAATSVSLGTVRRAQCNKNEVPWPIEGGYECQALESATKEATQFLNENMPPWDVLNKESLNDGILAVNVNLSLSARQNFSWAKAVPKDVWQEWVLPYASVNEARNDWREFMVEKVAPLVRGNGFQASTIQHVAETLNTQIWEKLGHGSPIVFKAQMTPLIYDPMSTMEYGYASCTGISILYVDALRTVGVPARVVGTPAWNGVVANGNHNWVEVWMGVEEGWKFIEGQPAGPGENFDNPKDKWFCTAEKFQGTQVFAARWSWNQQRTVYPMQWDVSNHHIPGDDRTAYYKQTCSAA